jgi:glycosyltransferase involved in cell wall biosynthesis
VNRNGETGIIVEKENVSELKAAILKLANDSQLRNSMGAAGRKRVKDVFSVEKMVSSTYSIYREILGEK